jgi:hypothetical protein
MKTTEKQIKGDLAYQKQLYRVLEKIVDLRTQLLTETAILANNCKPKVWDSPYATARFLEKRMLKEQDENLMTIAPLLKSLIDPIIKLEGNLTLKNSFIEAIGDISESFTAKEAVAVIPTRPFLAEVS